MTVIAELKANPPGIKLFTPVRRHRPAGGVRNHFKWAKSEEKALIQERQTYLFMSVFER